MCAGGAFDIWLNKTRRDSEINFEAIRFSLPLDPKAPVTATGITGRDVAHKCTGDLCDQIRLPKINPRYQGRDYCFAYGMQTKFQGGPFASQGIVRVDLCNKSVEAIPGRLPGQYPHELVFVPNPSGHTELDGVLIGHVLDGPANASFIHIIDASTLHTVASAKLPLRLGEMIHGNWFDAAHEPWQS